MKGTNKTAFTDNSQEHIQRKYQRLPERALEIITEFCKILKCDIKL